MSQILLLLTLMNLIDLYLVQFKFQQIHSKLKKGKLDPKSEQKQERNNTRNDETRTNGTCLNQVGKVKMAAHQRYSTLIEKTGKMVLLKMKQ